MKEPRNNPLVGLRNIVKTYQTGEDQVTVLNNITLSVQTGEFVSIVGPSGSGKSTLLNIITGIDRPTGGDVFFNGQVIHTMSENNLARWRGRNIGVVFQFFQLLPTLTIIENVMLPMDFCRLYRPKERRKRALRLLEEVGIARHAYKLPSALSGGEQQRAAVARALANDPPLIVADEPSGNLDTANAAHIFNLFRELITQDKTLIIVTHDQSLSVQAERIIHLIDGQISSEVAGNGRTPAAYPQPNFAVSTPDNHKIGEKVAKGV